MQKILPLAPDVPQSVEYYVDQFHFVEHEKYEIGLSNADKGNLNFKYQAEGKTCIQCIECFTEPTAEAVYKTLLAKGHKGIGPVLKTDSPIGTTKVFSLAKGLIS